MLRRALLIIVLSSCKPAEEPPRRPSSVPGIDVTRPDLGPPAGNVRVTERVTELTSAVDRPTAPPVIGGVARAPDHDTADSAIPDVIAMLDAAQAETVDAGPEADGTETFPVRPEDLPAELIALLALDVPQSARDEARRLNKLGLEAHKKLALDAAQVSYRTALDGFPAFPFARYNLACALALQKRDAEALFHLAVLRHLMDVRRDTVSRERLEAARVDADFDQLRDDPRFRALSGATGVLVSWVAGDVAGIGRKEAQALAKTLRERRWPARAASTPWQGLIPASTIRVRGGDPIAETAAKAIANLLQDASPEASATGWPIEIGAPLPPEAPPIVVILTSGQPAVAPESPEAPSEAVPGDVAAPAPLPPSDSAPPPDGTTFTTLADALGKRLRADRPVSGGLEHHQIEFKPTGFFVWDLVRPDGVRKRRSGRWSGGATQLSLTYKETTETPNPSAPSEAPAITIVEGLSSELKVEVGATAVVLDGLAFQ